MSTSQRFQIDIAVDGGQLRGMFHGASRSVDSGPCDTVAEVLRSVANQLDHWPNGTTIEALEGYKP